MDPILLFFVFPLVTIIIAIALQKMLNNPLLVGAVIFSMFLLVSFLKYGGTSQAIIASIIYGILAFVAALLLRMISNLRLNNMNNNSNSNSNSNSNNDANNSQNWPNTRACRICKCQRCICNGLRM